ncbi:MAG: hypothetical protein N3G21_10525 [Candidatus Hydrogenedentes bacterium]|nr:hypothetical protein [Candidatus Hydrogenedentota bacterium]
MKKKINLAKAIFFILVIGLLLPGCILSLIPLPEIKTSIKLFSASIPATSFEQWVNNEERSINKVCANTGFDVETLRQRAIEGIQKLPLSRWMTRLLTYAINEIEVKSVTVEKITLRATAGNFSKISKISAKIKINNSGIIDLGEGKFNQDKTEIYFDKKIEVLNYVNKNPSEQTCVEGSLTITGTLGTQAINFDGIFDISIKLSF